MNGYSTIPVIIGSEANYIQNEQREVPELSHRWKCYVRAQPSLIKSVQFRLHESFHNPVLNITEPPFEINEKGWGEFNIQIRILLFNDEKVQTSHYLALHAESYPYVSERTDTIVYRGSQEKIEDRYDFAYESEDEEYRRIDSAIVHVLDLYDDAKLNQM